MKTSSILCLAMLGIGTAGAAVAATPADRMFVAKVSQGGMYEVNAGKLAETRGSTQDVRDFAVAEVHDHQLVGAKLKAIAMREGIAVAATPNAEFAAKLNRLSGLSGKAFDARYIADMADLHAGDGAAFAKEAAQGGSPAFRSFGTESHRIVERHIGAINAVPEPR